MSKIKFKLVARLMRDLRDFLNQHPTVSESRVEDAIDVLSGSRKAVELSDHTKIEKPYARAEVARLLGRSPKTVDYYLKRGILKRVKRGNFSAESVRILLEGKPSAAPVADSMLTQSPRVVDLSGIKLTSANIPVVNLNN